MTATLLSTENLPAQPAFRDHNGGKAARVLCIGSGVPWTSGAGHLVRQRMFYRALAEIADLHFALFDCRAGEVSPWGGEITCLPPAVPPKQSRLSRLFTDLTDPCPRMHRGYDCSGPRSAVAALKPASFDAVFAYRIDFANFAGVLGMPRLLLDIDDPEHLRHERMASVISPQRRIDFRSARDLKKLRDFEYKSAASAVAAFVCQASDGLGWPVTPTVVPNCVDVPHRPMRNVTRPIVLFVGNCTGTNANVDAVLFFLKDIWPTILQTVPQAEFHLIGPPGPAVQQAVSVAPRAKLLGFVDRLADAYAEASISIAPIRFGTGTRIKILEAFAHACPVVATPPAADGINAVPGREIELGVTARDFALRCVAMLQDPATAQRIGDGGHSLVSRDYNTSVQHPILVQMLSRLIGCPSGATTV